jgi:hypothetical protein
MYSAHAQMVRPAAPLATSAIPMDRARRTVRAGVRPKEG